MSLINLDKNLLLALNSNHNDFWDGFMWMATDEKTWLVFFGALLFAIYKMKGKEFFFVLIAIALTVLLCDQISGFFKDWVARPRPTRETDIMHSVHIVNGYRGGNYGFFSSHAANTFGVAVLVSLIMRRWMVTTTMLLWAGVESYSRIYLGVHYPLDIMTGILCGTLVGFGIYKLHILFCKRFSFNSSSASNSWASIIPISFIVTLFMINVGSNAILDFLL